MRWLPVLPVWAFAGGLGLLGLVACGGGGGGSSSSNPAVPSITSFMANPTSITNGGSATLTGVFANGTGVITPGNITATSGTGLTVSPTSTTTYTLIVSATGQTSATQTALVTVTAATPASPTFTTTPPTTASVGTLYAYSPSASEPGATVTISLTSTLPVGATFASGVLSWTPTPTETGIFCSFTLEASDGKGGITYQSWSVTPSNAQGSVLEEVLYSFGTTSTDGSYPVGIIQATDGNFYGTTLNGGSILDSIGHGMGTVFKINPNGSELFLCSLGASVQEQAPLGGVIQGTDGNFYGTTHVGGTNAGGTVFKITSSGLETVLYNFVANGTDASGPSSNLIQATDGNFYGTTLYGGAYGHGTVFKITQSGSETILYSFGATTNDGSKPTNIIQGNDGNLYGITQDGGTYSGGTFFKISLTGMETVLYSFSSSRFDGLWPVALIESNDGNFYGVTQNGGVTPINSGGGTIFKVTPGGIETVLYSFGLLNIYTPVTLIQAKDGNFYGITSSGGNNSYNAHGSGTVFKFTPGGIENSLYSFGQTNADGLNPNSLIQGNDGNLYGTTSNGGANSMGTVFKISF